MADDISQIKSDMAAGALVHQELKEKVAAQDAKCKATHGSSKKVQVAKQGGFLAGAVAVFEGIKCLVDYFTSHPPPPSG